MRLLNFDFINMEMIKIRATLVSTRETIGYVTVGSIPNVILIKYILLKNNATSLKAFSKFSFSVYNTSDGIFRPLYLYYFWKSQCLRQFRLKKGCDGAT